MREQAIGRLKLSWFLLLLAAVLVAACSGSGGGAAAGKNAAATKNLPKTAVVATGESTGVVAGGVTIWNKAGGLLAPGSRPNGILTSGSEVELLGVEDFKGTKFYQVRGTGADASKEGWVEEKFVRLPAQ